jgi:hypothetical protein
MPGQYNVQFVDIQLDKAGKEKMQQWFDKLEPEFDPLAALLNLDYKVTVSWDGQNTCFCVYLVPIGSRHRNADCILTARAGSWIKAIYGAYYRSEVLKKGNWWVSKKENGISDDWA